VGVINKINSRNNMYQIYRIYIYIYIYVNEVSNIFLGSGVVL